MDNIHQPMSCVPYIHRTEWHGNADSEITDGSVFRNGTWTGIFGMLQRREVDVAYIPVTMSSSRWDVVDFTMPAVEMRYCHVYR
jgi:hypothetical protein